MYLGKLIVSIMSTRLLMMILLLVLLALADLQQLLQQGVRHQVNLCVLKRAHHSWASPGHLFFRR